MDQDRDPVGDRLAADLFESAVVEDLDGAKLVAPQVGVAGGGAAVKAGGLEVALEGGAAGVVDDEDGPLEELGDVVEDLGGPLADPGDGAVIDLLGARLHRDDAEVAPGEGGELLGGHAEGEGGHAQLLDDRLEVDDPLVLAGN